MCILCRTRLAQDSLLRLQCHEKQLVRFTGSGRSFYLCEPCRKEEKKLQKALSRQCRSGEAHAFLNQLKEIIADVR